MNQTEYENLQNYLPGLELHMPEAYKKLAEIIKYQVFELHFRQGEDGKTRCYIPYMMNDALECYLILTDCRITGVCLPDFEGKTEAYLTENQGSGVLVVRQGEENVFTLWFEELQEELCCYRYHEIGHFWVKGQEQWRQLVYIIGTIYDKFEYLGDAVCTKKELELLPLMEFAPFRGWSPVRETLDDCYIDTLDGVEYMKTLVLEAGDRRLAVLLDFYKKRPDMWVENRIKRILTGKRGRKIYQLIWDKVRCASEEYPVRDYGSSKNAEIQGQRQNVADKLYRQGFRGQYPFFYRGDMQIMATEEHPFTILEAEDFDFRIQFMVSKSRNGECMANSGFFRGRGNRGWIEQNLDFLENEFHQGR